MDVQKHKSLMKFTQFCDINASINKICCNLVTFK